MGNYQRFNISVIVLYQPCFSTCNRALHLYTCMIRFLDTFFRYTIGSADPAQREVVKVYADCVRVLEPGTVTGAEVETDIRRGRILRPARQGGAGDEEATYFGLVEDKDTGRPYPYTLTSQVDMRLHLQVTNCSFDRKNEPKIKFFSCSMHLAQTMLHESCVILKEVTCRLVPKNELKIPSQFHTNLIVKSGILAWRSPVWLYRARFEFVALPVRQRTSQMLKEASLFILHLTAW